MKTDQLILYRNMAYEDLLMEMNGALDSDGKKEDVWSLANRLIELAAKYGLEGNLWHCFLALCIANHENAYSISCEIRGKAGGSLDSLALEDFRIFKELFDYDIRRLGGRVWEILADYRPAQADSRVFNRRIRDRIVNLAVQLEQARTAEEFQAQAISPIICEGDAIGSVIITTKEPKTRFGETEQKLTSSAAGFLGKQMET